MRIIGIGASAGGLEALNVLFDNIPADTGAAYVIIQHLSPDYQSLMDSLLSKHTSMPIEVVEQMTPVRADHIYLISPNFNLIIEGGILKPKPRDKVVGLNLPIDEFFHSLGMDQRENAIGIILSGTGTDGSRGARTIKQECGILMVQDPDTARFDGMPMAAISIGLSDSILSPFGIAEKIVQITDAYKSGKDESLDLSDEKNEMYFRKIVQCIYEITGVNFKFYRRQTLYRRAFNRMKILKIANLNDYYGYIRADQSEAKRLCKEFLIGVSSFFRDATAFKLLEEQIIPKIIEQNADNKMIRIWVPACSTGEEAYTIGMLLLKYLRTKKLDINFKIFATDVNKDAVNFASEGVYPNNIAADIHTSLLGSYFQKLNENSYQVNKILRDHLVFAVHNLLEDPPFIHMDLISCRNFLIYLLPQMQQQVLSKFHFSLSEHGYLMLGNSESVGDLADVYEPIAKKWNLYRKINDKNIYEFESKAFSASRRKDLRVSPYKEAINTIPSFGTQPTDIFSHYLSQKYAPVSIFVDKELNIRYINGDIGQVLSFPQTFAEFNLRTMLNDEDSLFFWNGVRKVFEAQQPILYKEVLLHKGAKALSVNIRFEVVKFKQQQEPIVHIELEILEHDPVVVPEKEIVVDRGKLKDEKIKSLDEELRQANQRSILLVEKLETTNEELQASNEELLASNEELQSTNEELQSVNEELHTVNTELQTKINELGGVNNDIYNLLKGTDIGTVFLDKSLKIRRFTPAINRQFDFVETDIGRPISNFSSAFSDLDISSISEQVLQDLKPYEQKVVDLKNNHYLMRILPYHTEEDSIEGIVITFSNITNLVQTQKEAEALASRFKAIYKHSRNVFIITDRDGAIQQMNRAFGGFTLRSFQQKSIADFTNKEGKKKLETAIQQAFLDKMSTDIEIALRTAQRKKLWMNVTIIPGFINDKADYLTLILEDVTEQKRDQELMEETTEKFRSIFEHAHDQFIIVDQKGIIQAINYVRDQKVKNKKVIGTSVFDLLSTKEAITKTKEMIDEVYQGAPSRQYKINNIQDNKSLLHLSLTVSPIFVGGKIKLVSLIIRDETSARKTESDYEMLRRKFKQMVTEKTEELANANEELAKINSFLDSFVHGAAHDLRSPLVVLKSFVELIPRYKDEEKRKQALQNMKEATLRLENTLQGMVELVDFQKNDEHIGQDLTFEELFENAKFQLMNEIEYAQPTITADFSKAPDIHYIKAYLTSILTNLLSNALKYKKMDTPCQIGISTELKEGYVLLTVKDNGIGMDLERYGHLLFKPFKRLTSERSGTGIGLSIIKEVIEKNGGRIEVQSRLTKGSTFAVWLKPYSKEELTKSADDGLTKVNSMLL